MSEFEYKVSVIVPVYNVEQYLRDCPDSLLAQTIDHDQMEVLLINDGSTDNSLGIYEEYAELFSCFKLFSKENEGLSATRNFGIERAKGKYLMYIDSDDMFTPETVKTVTDFFDTVYDVVDMVTYLDQPYRNRVDDKVILSNPTTDTFHRHFFLNLKSDAKSAVVAAQRNLISVFKNGTMLYPQKNLKLY